MGIEPTWPVWKTGTLPLSYTRFSVQGQILLSELALSIRVAIVSPNEFVASFRRTRHRPRHSF